MLKVDRIQVQTEELGLQRLPGWAKSMILIGWWMRKHSGGSARLFMPFLLPARYCCSAFCGLGSLLNSLTKDAETVTWNEFESLENNTRIYFVHYGDLMEGTVGAFTEVNRERGRQVYVEKGPKKYQDSSLSIFPDYIQKYHVSLTPHAATKRQTKKLSKAAFFYKETVEGFNEACIDKGDVETLIVSNKAAWDRQNENISLTYKGKTHLQKITQLLMKSDNVDSGPSKTLLQSPKTAQSMEVPLVILDGPDALQNWQLFTHANIIILLSHTEYDQEAMDLISMLASCRDESIIPDKHTPNSGFPPGCESMLFAVQQT